MDRKRAASASVALAADTRPTAADTNKDPFTYASEKERFLKDLRQFHDGRGTTIPRWPYIGGRSVDLYALYTAVTQLGGWEKVSNDETWCDIQDRFGIPPNCGNADHALRQIYIRYLNAYEKLHHFGQDPDSREDTTDLDDLPSSRKKTVGPVGGVAVTYNYQQHNLHGPVSMPFSMPGPGPVGSLRPGFSGSPGPDPAMPYNLHESTREMLGLTKEVNRSSEYANLERSLASGLPNEVDFAVNICLLLSTEGKHTLKGSRGLRIVELLLAQVGICKESELALIWLISESKLNFLRFWNESVDDLSVKELVCPECLLIDKVEEYRVENGMVDDGVDISSVLNLGRGLGTEDREAQRVIQLAVITRNLSFEEENLEPFASSLMVLRFIMLCAYNKHGCIRQLALDTMANVAIKMNLEPVDCGMTLLVLRTVSSCLLSWDKFQIISALETLSRLCQMESNEDAICCQLDDAIYDHLVRLLTIEDLQLIVSALETIYQLSEIGTATSNRIAQVSASVDVLVALLTLEAESYGPNALLGVSAVENSVEISNAVPGQTMGPPPARLPSVVSRPPAAVPCVVTPSLSITQMSPSFLPPRAPLIAFTAPASVAPSPPPPATVRCNPGPGSIVNSEAAACNWLRAQYEVSSDRSVKKMDMYRKYASTFGIYGLQSLVGPACFADCIRVAFPGVEPESTDKDGTGEVVYKGLTSRQKPGPFSPTTGNSPSNHQAIPNASSSASSGLLPLASSTQTGANGSQLVASFPAIQQVLLSSQGRPDPSSDGLLGPRPAGTGGCEPNFVKTLLASKVTQHMNRVNNQQGVDTLDAGNIPPNPHNGTTLVNSFPGVNIGDLDGATVAVCSEISSDPARRNSPSATLASGGAPIANKSVLSEHSYIQTEQPFYGGAELGQTTGEVVDGLGSWDGERGLEENISAGGDLNSLELACEVASSFNEVGAPLPTVMNGSLSLCRNQEKWKNDAENARSISGMGNHVGENANGKEFGLATNGVVRGVVNGDCGVERGAEGSGRKPRDDVVIDDRLGCQRQCSKAASFASRLTLAEDATDVLGKSEELGVDGVEKSNRLKDVAGRSENGSWASEGPVCPASSSEDRYEDDPMSSDELSPFPSTFSNVDGVSDSVTDDCGPTTQKIEAENDGKIGADPTRSLLGPDRVCVDPARSDAELDLNTECPFGEGMSATTENDSDILLLEDFTVAHEELISDQDQSTVLDEPEMDNSLDPSETRFLEFSSGPSVTFQSAALPSSSLSAPISIPASIQARLASFQLGAYPTGVVQSRLPLAISRLPVSVGPDQPGVNPRPVTFFSQTYPANDTGQNLQTDPSASTASSIQMGVRMSSVCIPSLQQPSIDGQTTGAFTLPATNQPTETMVNPQPTQNATQMVFNHPPGPPLFVAPSSSGAVANQGAHRIQFLSSPMGAGQPPQLHKFVSSTTPGHIIIQRAQLMPQGQQQQRPLQQPIFQRFFVSQSGGMPQRQIVIQSNPMMLHQGGAAGQLRPGFVQQTGQSPSGPGQQPLVVQSTGQMLPPQQRHVVQAGQLTGYRFIQQGVTGQQGQGLGQHPLLVQQGGPQSQVLVGQQQGQVVVQQQQGLHTGLQDPKTGSSATGVGQAFAHQGQSSDQPMPHGQGQMLGQGQMIAQQGQTGQMMTQQGQTGQVIMQQGQTGQMMTQQGQAGQVIMQQGQTGQMMTQQGQTGQVIVQQGHMITQQGQVGQMITHQGQLGQMVTTPQGHIFTQQGQLLVGQQGQILCHAGQQGSLATQGTGPLVIQHSGGQIVLQSGSGGLQNCIMFQQGVKRMVDASKDPSSLALPTTSTASYRIITANAPLHSGNGPPANIQQQLQGNTGVGQASLPVSASPVTPSSVSAAKRRKPSTSHSRSAKKRRKDDEDSVGGDVDSAQGKAVQYVCEWNGCQGSFASFSSILQHATKEHFEANKEAAITCEWAGCDGLKRQRWSFMTHLQDRHVNEANLKTAAVRRLQQAPGAASPPPSSAPPVLPTAVYPPNAALQAIRRFSARPPFPEMLDAKETPVTKHIHLTSALILRNLARYSSLGRSLIKRHEKHLAYIAFSETESSSAISNCLWELQGL